MKVAPEGWPFIAGAFFILVGLTLASFFLGTAGWGWAAIIWLPVFVWVVAFFRDPTRDGERGDGLLIAPADGVVIGVDRMESPEFLVGEQVRVAIFMNVFNVHVNRSPANGEIVYKDYRPGKFFNASFDKASVHNERCSIGLRARDGDVLIQQIAGLVARRIVTDPEVGDSVSQGNRFGIIRFGSRVDTYMPTHMQPVVKVGDKTRAGETVIARRANDEA